MEKKKKKSDPILKDGFDPLQVESKKAATVVLMLNSPEVEILCKACEALYKFAEKSDENKDILVGMGAVESLCKLMYHEDKLVCMKSCMALGIMAANKEAKAVLKNMDIIPLLISRLSQNEEIVIHEFATLCLDALSTDFTCKVQICEAGGMAPLVLLLSSPDPDVIKNSVECIYNLVQDHPSRAALHKLKGFLPLMQLLSSEFPVIQQLALRTLARITTDPDSREALRKEKCLERMLEILDAKELNDLHMDTLPVVSNCLEDPEALQMLQESGDVDKLLLFVSSSGQQDVQKDAAMVLSKAAQSNENRKVLHESNAENSLVSLLAAGSTTVCIPTCHAVAAMAEYKASKEAFRNLGGIKQLVRLLGSENRDMVEAAALALSSLTKDSQVNTCAVFESKAAETLVKQLQVGTPQAAAHAAAILSDMAVQESMRDNILSYGVLQALLIPLQMGDPHVVTSAALAVAALTCDTNSRVEFRNAGGLTPLVNHLSSKNSEVRSSVCWAIHVCANDELSAIEMCRLGALEKLQDINQSRQRRNKFSESAFQQLLESNLSIKYSLTGHLSTSNITTDGFYDPGQARPGCKVLVLEDLSKEPVDQRRPIIIINGKPPEPAPASEKQLDNQSTTRSSSSLSKSSGKLSRCMSCPVRIKSKSKVRKEEEKPQEKIEISVVEKVPPVVVEKAWTLPIDLKFYELINKAAKSLLPLRDEREQYVTLARLVSDAMGGPIERDKQHEFLWELHLSEIKHELQSNLIPIGCISKGIFYHRALLYKVLADRLGVSCSLVRGEYGRAWNEVKLIEGPAMPLGYYPHPQTYVVDLMHSPGLLMLSGSPAATQYQII